MSAVITLLEARLVHLKREEERQPRTQYAQLIKWRRLECEYLLEQLRKLEEGK